MNAYQGYTYINVRVDVRSMDVAVIREASKLNLEVIEVPETRKKVAGGLYEGWIYEISLKQAS